jgi:ribonucleoside-triphosphate reductase
MQIKIQKRDGKIEEFLSFKIKDAIKKAFSSENISYDDVIFLNIMKKINNTKHSNVECIQDMIETELYEQKYFKVMRSFMLYRHIHKLQREQTIDDDTTYVNTTQTIKEYIDGNDWRIKANSNTGYSSAGLINNTAGKVIANYWLGKI